MGKSDSILGFKLMSLSFKIRDLFLPRINVLNQAGRSQGVFRKDCAGLT